MWAAKWLHEKKVYSDTLINYPSVFKKEPRNSFHIVKSLWKLMDEADIIVGQNSNHFDLRWLNFMFVKYGIEPPSPYKTVDTKLFASKNMLIASTKLEYMTKSMNLVEHKSSPGGFSTWLGCMAGDKKAWDKMEKYCKQDIIATEELYKKFRPYIPNHPNMNFYLQGDEVCVNCGSPDLQKKGLVYLKTNIYQRFRCKACGHKMRSRKSCDTQRVKLVS